MNRVGSASFSGEWQCMVYRGSLNPDASQCPADWRSMQISEEGSYHIGPFQGQIAQSDRGITLLGSLAYLGEGRLTQPGQLEFQWIGQDQEVFSAVFFSTAPVNNLSSDSIQESDGDLGEYVGSWGCIAFNVGVATLSGQSACPAGWYDLRINEDQTYVMGISTGTVSLTNEGLQFSDGLAFMGPGKLTTDQIEFLWEDETGYKYQAVFIRNK
jgi:hypothetical protein